MQGTWNRVILAQSNNTAGIECGNYFLTASDDM